MRRYDTYSYHVDLQWADNDISGTFLHVRNDGESISPVNHWTGCNLHEYWTRAPDLRWSVLLIWYQTEWRACYPNQKLPL